MACLEESFDHFCNVLFERVVFSTSQIRRRIRNSLNWAIFDHVLQGSYWLMHKEIRCHKTNARSNCIYYSFYSQSNLYKIMPIQQAITKTSIDTDIVLSTLS